MPMRRYPDRVALPTPKFEGASRASADDAAAALVRKYPGAAISLVQKIIEVTKAMDEKEKHRVDICGLETAEDP